ncbi:MAG: hypothetical protein Hyperionvirus19_8 [Hyperionvirus sp.]|uniref:Uncharacterized protein n=1 Tax=Hyperionvirus sp. TaxID=2487770 RepID=A0A3G5AC73_9VIRU|nr:MAG: hypothetical protein Hyperionvirus19_8 [Hyperionvirus sp.]
MNKYTKDLTLSEQILDQLEKIRKSLETEMTEHLSLGINSEYFNRLNSFDQSESSTTPIAPPPPDLTDHTDNNAVTEADSMTMNNLPLAIISITTSESKNKKYKFIK